MLTEKFGFDFVRLPNIIELNRSIVFDYVRLPNVRLPTPGIKIVLRKKLLKVLASPKTHFGESFLFQNLVLHTRYDGEAGSSRFFADLKLYL